MKTIRVEYATTANKFWGIYGLIMHAAICNASHQTVQYKGGIYSQLSGVSRWVSVGHEDRNLSLVAKLSKASFSKFLSHSLNANIKKSNLKGFFTFIPRHAQSVVGMAGLLKGRLASLGLSISKYHIFSPNLHFSLLTKTRGMKTNLMLKRISVERQSHLTERAVNFEEDLGIKNSSAIEVMKIDHHE